VDCHHLRVHGERDIGEVAAPAHGLEGCERGRLGIASCIILLRLLVLLPILLLMLLFHLLNSRAVVGAGSDLASLECASIEARTVVVESLSDYLATADDDAAMAIVKWRLRSLLEAEGEIIVRLHLKNVRMVGGGEKVLMLVTDWCRDVRSDWQSLAG